MGNVNLLEIEVAYALPHRQFLRRLKVPSGSKVREAIVQSGVLSKFPEIDLKSVRVGIFSRPVGLDDSLNTGDRVEIYRPLILSPTDARRLRAERQKTLATNQSLETGSTGVVEARRQQLRRAFSNSPFQL